MGKEISPRQNEVGDNNIKFINYNDSNMCYLSMEDAARFLLVSKSKIQKMSASRIIPVYKPSGGKVYFKRQDLIDYIDSGKQMSINEICDEALSKMRSMRKVEKSQGIILKIKQSV